MTIEILAIICLLVNYACATYLMYKLDFDLDSTLNRILVVGAYCLNATLAVYTPVFFVAMFAFWVCFGLFVSAWIVIHESV